MVEQIPVVIKGAGEMASGIAVRLYRAGFRKILFLETPRPLAVRREVSFSEAVYDGVKQVEGITAQRLDTFAACTTIWHDQQLAVAVDPEWRLLERMEARVSVDAVIAKRNLGTRIDEAPLVVALGPGFSAGVDAHYVIETQRGHDLGRVLASGSAQANTGVPGNIGGYTAERVLRAPVAGVVEQCLQIGDRVAVGQCICRVGGVEVLSSLDGVVRGCLRPGIEVAAGVKLGDVDPRGKREYCFTVSEKARALGGAVLEVLCGTLL